MTTEGNASLPNTMDQWIEWIDSQPVNSWRIFTLEYPRWTQKGMWSKPVSDALRELDQTFLTNPLKQQNLASGATRMRRVIALGGDKGSGTAYHVHGLIDGIGSDEKFDQRLRTVWTNTVRKHAVGAFHEDEVKTWFRGAVNGFAEYMKYMVRYEGNDLKFGVDKIDVPNTYLTPPTSRRLDTRIA